MQLVFESLTGNVRRFTRDVHAQLGALGVRGVDVLDLRVQAPTREFLLLTYTFGRGDVPAGTRACLDRHAGGLRGVVASGSYHWGAHFARAADVIAAERGVPVVAKLNKGGTAADRERVARWVAAQLPAAPFFSAQEDVWNAGLN